MPKVSAGLLMYRVRAGMLEVLLAHPGGPFWRTKDAGVWTIPKGEAGEGESLLECARREFVEETGFEVRAPLIELGSITQKSGKIVHVWAFAGDCDPATLRSNTTEVEWPPRSGKRIEVPEVDRAEFFDLTTARAKINPAQIPLLERLERGH